MGSGKPTAGDQLAAVRLLLREAGVAGLMAGIVSARSDPSLFSTLPPATDARERASREQAAPAILLYRALRERVGQERALEVVGAVVRAGAIRFLGRQLPDLDLSAWASWGEAERERRAAAWLERFFTATAELQAIEPEQVRFVVHACALHRLSVAAGHPELAPVFCRGDADFFATRGVDLQVPERIAAGDGRCHFVLGLAPEG